MKKFIPITLICLLVLGLGSTALAAGNLLTGPSSSINQTARAEMAQHQQNIRANREKITSLNANIKNSAAQLHSAIQTKLKDKSTINAAEIQTLRTAVVTIRQERLNLVKDHWGKVQEQSIVLRQAVLNKDFSAANQALTNIETEQQSRIKDLTTLQNNLQTVVSTI